MSIFRTYKKKCLGRLRKHLADLCLLAGLPGDTIEEWVFDEFGSWSQWNQPLHALGNGSSQLIAGKTYWLWTIADDTTWTMWCLNDIGDVGKHTLRREGEDWLPVGNETRSVFRIDFADPCPADITGDGTVDVLDLLEVLSQWGTAGTADITGDGIVDVLDLLEVLSAWGPCE